jgi:pyrimidine-nucleoside phosphorylase
MKKIGDAFDIKTDIVYSNMDQPLGNYAGLSCEILETIDCLKGKGPDDLMSVTFELGSKLILQSGLSKSKSDAIGLQTNIIESGEGLKKFENSVQNQGGRLDEFYSQSIPDHEAYVFSNKTGIIQHMDTEQIGWSLVEMGCVVQDKSKVLDKSAGMEFLKKTGDEINSKDPIFRVFCSNKKILDEVSKSLHKTLIIGEKYPKPKPIIL